ncbi:MAG TPA: hypothetical protein VLH94_00885 [Spirochaetia bacterium]|nr:hypothetical protein [Spirochaetia bacterium]
MPSNIKLKSNVLRMDDMSVAIQILTNLLINRVFDFRYRLSGQVDDVVSKSQKLLKYHDNPIHLEKRGSGVHQKEYLVFSAEDEDLLVSVSDWTGALDIEIREGNKEIVITNNDDDWHLITIHNGSTVVSDETMKKMPTETLTFVSATPIDVIKARFRKFFRTHE